MIKILKIKNGIPVSVIVPLSKSREAFFNGFILPLLKANNPAEIIINDAEGSAPKKRNDGFKHATQKYVFFCDDDILLSSNHLKTLVEVLETIPEKGYAYTGYDGIVLNPKSHPLKGNFTIKSQPFSPEALRKGNYISTMSLIRKEISPQFDESLPRFQDWSLYLTLLEKGITGIYVDNFRFLAFYLDEGITAIDNTAYAKSLIKAKHRL